MFNQIQEIVATSPISQVASMVEYFFALFFVAILISLFLSVKNQKDSDELNEVIEQLNEEGTRIEDFMKDKYKLSNIEEAIKALEKLQATIVDFLYKITEAIV